MDGSPTTHRPLTQRYGRAARKLREDRAALRPNPPLALECRLLVFKMRRPAFAAALAIDSYNRNANGDNWRGD